MTKSFLIMNCARGCSPPTEEERQNIMKWSEKIENLLVHDQGKDRFRRFLNQFDLEEDLDSLEFWEMSCELENLAFAVSESEKRSSLRSASCSLRDQFNTKSNSLVEFAMDKINLDLQQLKQLETIKNNPDKCRHIMPKTKASILYLLKDSYDQFIDYQLNSRLSITY